MATTATRWMCWYSVPRPWTPDAGAGLSHRLHQHAGRRQNDEKIIAIPFSDPTYNTYQDIWELPGHIFDEMAHFFPVYKALEGKEAVAGDVNDRKAAIQVICKAMDHYNETFLGSSDHTRSGTPPVDHTGTPLPLIYKGVFFKQTLILFSFSSLLGMIE